MLKLFRDGKIWTIPNFMSFFRLLLVPFIVWAYVGLQNTKLAIILLAVSALTDVLDGRIARRFNMVSDLGKALDPVADKLTQVCVVLCLYLSPAVDPSGALRVPGILHGNPGLYHHPQDQSGPLRPLVREALHGGALRLRPGPADLPPNARLAFHRPHRPLHSLRCPGPDPLCALFCGALAAGGGKQKRRMIQFRQPRPCGHGCFSSMLSDSNTVRKAWAASSP